ncbi:MAG: pyridoxal 5'-phosphate synthase [Panacagrimonas sp.]
MTDIDPIFEAAISRLASLIEDARNRGAHEASSAALATASADARPSVRTVGIVRVSTSGLVLFANTETGKGQQMQINPRAALCFHWRVLQYEVIVEGEVALLSEGESDAEWDKLPRDVSVGHWASDQTQADVEPAALKQNVQTYRKQFDWDRVPRAPSWRAFEIRPDRITFWQTGWQRLRVRERYLKSPDGSWVMSKDNP